MDLKQDSFRRDLVVIGGSSGAIDVLKFIGGLPSDFPATILLVIHISADGPALLPDIIGAYSKIPVENACNGARMARGHIYVAPPDHHLTVVDGLIEVARGPRENRHRPSIDVLFRSAAAAYGPRVVGVILSGMLDDGSAGLLAIRRQGGLGIIQEPEDALFSDMPRNALAYAGADHCVPSSQLAALLVKAVGENLATESFRSFRKEGSEANISEVAMDLRDDGDKPGMPTNLSCPDCGGVLQHLGNEEMLRFRCRVGHAYSAQTLLAAQSDRVEEALWAAVRLLEEKAEMARRLQEYSAARNFKAAPGRFEEQAKKLEGDAQVIRKLLKSTSGGESD